MQVKAETKKVAWPTRKETMMTAVMVLIMTTMLGVFFFGIDLLFSKVREAIFALLV
nr:preprotein translocase subunit SecE [Sphingomonas quercus]